MKLSDASAELVKIQQELDVAKTAAVARAQEIIAIATQHAEAHEHEARAAREIINTASGIAGRPLENADTSGKFVLTRPHGVREVVPAFKIGWRIPALCVAAAVIMFLLIHSH
jgi:hypothetical protein